MHPQGLGRGGAQLGRIRPSCPDAPRPDFGGPLPAGPQDSALLLPWKGEARPAALEAGLQAERFLKIRWERGRTKGKWGGAGEMFGVGTGQRGGLGTRGGGQPRRP